MGYDLHDMFQHAAKFFYRRYKAKGGSQKELADELGVTQSYLSSVINGSRTASLEMHSKIAKVLYGPYDKFLKAGRQIMDGHDPTEQKKTNPYDSVENLIAHLTHYVMEQQLIQKQLRISEEKFRDISLTSGDMIFELDKDFTFTFISGNVKEVIGLTEDDLVGKNTADFVGPEEWARVKPLIDQAIANRTIFNEVLSIERDSQTYYRHLIAKPVFTSSSDKFIKVRGTYRDITKRKRLEKELTEQIFLFQSAIDIFEEDGLLFIDKNNKAMRWNECYKDLIGYPDEVLETRDLNLYLKYLKPMIADLMEYEQGMKDVMESKEKSLHYCKFKDGRTIKRQVYPIFKDGELSGRILRLQDVTDVMKKKKKSPPKKARKK